MDFETRGLAPYLLQVYGERVYNRNHSDMPRLEPLCDVKTVHDWGRLWARAVRETPATAPRSSWQAGALRRGLEALLCF